MPHIPIQFRSPSQPGLSALGGRRLLAATRCLLLVSLCCITSGVVAQEWILSPDQHGWGRFKPGSWKTVRVITDMLDAKGMVTSTTKTETTTTLVEKKSGNYTLEVKVTVEIGDRRITSDPKMIKRNFRASGDSKINLKRLGKADDLDFNGTRIPLEKMEVTLRGEIGRRYSVILFSKDVPPFVYNRKTVLYDKQDKPLYKTQVSVVEHGLAHKILGETKTVCHIKTVHSQNKKVTTSVEIYCADVPGGIISHRFSETNGDGKVTRRSTLELLDYGMKDNSGRREGKRS